MAFVASVRRTGCGFTSVMTALGARCGRECRWILAAAMVIAVWLSTAEIHRSAVPSLLGRSPYLQPSKAHTNADGLTGAYLQTAPSPSMVSWSIWQDSVHNFFFSLVPDTVYVIPGFASYTQRCRVNIVPEYNPGFNCSVGHTLLRYSVWPDDQHTIPVQFNVLGARPIDISVDVVWFNHYPVDLHPSYNPVANTSTILHVSTLYCTPRALHTKFFHTI